MSLMTAQLSNQIPTILILLGIICCVGLVGNFLVIIVYALKHDRFTSTLFILILAITDFFACCTLIPGTMLIEYLEWHVDSTFLCKFYYFMNNTFIPFSSLLITSIGIDRYFCICHPFLNLITLARAKHMIFYLILLSVSLGLSSTLLVRVERVENSERNNNNRLGGGGGAGGDLLSDQQTYIYECTEISKLNNTFLERILFHVIQKSQTCSYILCILTVVTSYILIYHKVTIVVKKRLELKNGVSNTTKSKTVKNETIIIKDSIEEPKLSLANDSPETELKSPTDEQNPTSINQHVIQELSKDKPKCLKNSGKHPKRVKDTVTFPNMKIAIMLFVVAITYIVTFLPAMLMAIEFVPLYLPVFYLYYINNAINPIIYGFMNPNFRKDIHALFCKQSHCCKL